LSTTISNNPILAAGANTTLSIQADPTGLAIGNYTGSILLQPSVGGTLTISVNFTVGGTGSFWSATPSSIPWSFTPNSGSYPSQAVTLAYPAGQAIYSISLSTQSGGQWLLASTVTQTTPSANPIVAIPVALGFTLSLGTVANNLAQGTYTGQVTISDSNGVPQTSVTVTLTVSGGSTLGLTVDPTLLSFANSVGGPQQSKLVTVTSSTGGTLSVAGCNLVWLNCALPTYTTLSPGVPVTFTVFAQPIGLSADTYTSPLTVRVGTQSATVNVSLSVGGGTGTTFVSPASLNFDYQLGTPQTYVTKQKLVITGPAGPWSAVATVTSSSTNWLTVSPASGSALPNPSDPVAAPVVSVDPSSLTAPGIYGGSITVTTAGGAQVIHVFLNVYSSTILLPSPAGSMTFTGKAGGPKAPLQALYWIDSDTSLHTDAPAVTATTTTPWITLSGLSNGMVIVQADPTNLSAGVSVGSISLGQVGAANSPVTIPVLLVVGAGSSSGALTFSPSTLSFNSASGSTPAAQTLSVTAATPTAFTAAITYANGSGWLSVSPLTGTASSTAANLSVSAVATGMGTGSYGATIAFTANGVVQTVGVTLTVGTGSTGSVSVAPTSLSFSAVVGSSPASQTLSVTSAVGSAGVSFTVIPTTTSGGTWLSTSVGTGTTPLNTLTVNVNSSGLAANTYQGSILIIPNGGTAVTVPVTLTVSAPSNISATPTQMTFNYVLGASAPTAQPITVSGNGTFSATAISTGNWLAVSPTAGNAPGTVNASINPANIPNGTPPFTGTIVVAGTGAVSGTTTITVTLSVTSPLPTLSKVTNAASYSNNAISPGEIITLFANDPTHPIGPATPAGLTLDANGNVATIIGGTQVLIQGYACPMIYASASQVSAVVPYELKRYTTATVLVKFLGQSSNGVQMPVAATVPGLFTANATGTGPGAILNSDSGPNDRNHPAARGDIIVLYLTGEGETSPNGVTGKLTTLATPPQPLTPAPLLPVSVTIGGQSANWTFAGEAPFFVSGVMQLNVIVPTNIAAGDQPVVVTIGGNSSQAGVTVLLK
jgi:uncharacterized protein (TIGR03437 family)